MCQASKVPQQAAMAVRAMPWTVDRMLLRFSQLRLEDESALRGPA